MIDNFDRIKDLLKFESEDNFYYLQILQRKKENPNIGSNSEVVKTYYIGNMDYLEDKYNEIKSLSDYFNARATLRLNKRSYKKVAFKTMEITAKLLASGNYRAIKNSYNKACGIIHNDENKKWIVDVDGETTEDFLNTLISDINDCSPSGEKVITQLPTKNGVHLITKPFNKKSLKEKYYLINYWIDIHKDNPVNLYIP